MIHIKCAKVETQEWLKQLLKHCKQIKKIVLFEAVGTSYEGHTDTPLSRLGLDYCKIKKVTHNLRNP